MKLRHLIFFLRRNLRRRPGRTLTALATIAVAVAVFHLTAGFALALRSEMLAKLEAIFPERSLVVRARSVELGPLAFSASLLAPRLTPQTVQRIAALPGVEAVWPQMALEMPAMAVGTLAGYEGSTDVVLYGVPRDLVAPDVVGARGFYYADPATTTVPVIVPRYFVDMFNLGLAESYKLPKLTDKAVVGRHFTLFLGDSLLLPETDSSRVRKVRCEIVGLTRNPSLMGLLVPIEYVRRFNRWHQGGGAQERYVQVHVVLRRTADYDEVVKKIESFGLQVEGRRETARRLRLVVNGAALVSLVFGLAVLALALVNIVNTFALIMLERRGEIGLLRAVGATRRATMALLAAESLAVGAAGGALGSASAWLVSRILNEALSRWLPPLSISPDYWFDTRAGLFFFCVIIAGLGSALVTAPMLWRSTGRWPADLLREY